VDCLILKPVNSENVMLYEKKLKQLMSELDIIDAPMVHENNNYYFAGSNYLQHISFLGCSPYLNFEPKNKFTLTDVKQTIADLNYIEFVLNSNNYLFNNINFGVKAICPKCKKRITQWQEIITAWQENLDSTAPCPQCQQTISILNINWKKTAGFYKSAIIFHGIQAELALPSDNFLLQLEKTTDQKWLYFYG